MYKTDHMLAFGKRIRAARERAGFTQEDVAEAVGVSRTAVTRWEQGVIEPKLRNLMAIAKKLGVSSDYLLGLDENPQVKQLALSKRAEKALEELVLEIRAERTTRGGNRQ